MSSSHWMTCATNSSGSHIENSNIFVHMSLWRFIAKIGKGDILDIIADLDHQEMNCSSGSLGTRGFEPSKARLPSMFFSKEVIHTNL